MNRSKNSQKMVRARRRNRGSARAPTRKSRGSTQAGIGHDVLTKLVQQTGLSQEDGELEGYVAYLHVCFGTEADIAGSRRVASLVDGPFSELRRRPDNRLLGVTTSEQPIATACRHGYALARSSFS